MYTCLVLQYNTLWFIHGTHFWMIWIATRVLSTYQAPFGRLGLRPEFILHTQHTKQDPKSGSGWWDGYGGNTHTRGSWVNTARKISGIQLKEDGLKKKNDVVKHDWWTFLVGVCKWQFWGLFGRELFCVWTRVYPSRKTTGPHGIYLHFCYKQVRHTSVWSRTMHLSLTNVL